MSLRRGSLLVVAACSLLASCAQERASLSVALEPATASRFLAHGNCFAGWFLDFGLSVGETQGVDVVIEGVTVRVDDEQTGRELGATGLDAAALREHLGTDALVRGRDALHIPVSVRPSGSSDRPDMSGFIVASGLITGRDEHGGVVRASFRLSGTVAINGGPLPSGGACSAPAP